MKKIHSSSHGFSLVECVVAVGIVCVSILPMLGLLPAGLNSTRSASAQTGAMNLITAIAADLRATSIDISPRFSISKVATANQTVYFDDFGAVTASQATSRYKADIQVIRISSTKTISRVTVIWPPQASVQSALGSVDVVVSL